MNIKIEHNIAIINREKVILPERIDEFLIFRDMVVLLVYPSSLDIDWGTSGDKERWLSKFNWEGGNVFCYDAKGALLWQWHEKGITGMRLVDQEYIEEQRRSINTSRETLLEKGYSEDKIVAKDYVNPLLHPEGQIELFNGIGMAHLVEIATGKELDRWETR
ncbi:hypothetical protein [Polaribacter sp. HL-MS24]|uniref:hypothetical protein n=1 Tax=Polaribacter sp. HL-MS24 TaxID=3077735 RepID=UPI00293467EB|nr:hypothetical protein [Polaribacter sp. HL-MS24]WOC40019.1 hypothetical protein RRF69_10420 [Polaribacter sp. HL-MS24]